MKYPVVFTPAANDDFLEGLDWYDEQQAGLGKRFDAAIVEAIELIGGNPRLYAVRRKSIRAAVVSTLPYLIFYKFESQRQCVVVLAILHQSRNPKVWMKRQT
jgi:plasmid stabilization system protein ParE